MPKTEDKTKAPKKQQLLRHLVEMRDGEPAEQALCGYVWDRINISEGPVCEECYKEALRRQRQNRA